jgi:glycosyltransferase involved in cell wall biosynthesis
VLSAHPRAYDITNEGQLGDVPKDSVVKRAAAFNTRKHLSLRGRYFKFMALPDHWISWLFAAVPAGLGLIRRHRATVLWSTYPIASAHLIGLVLHRLTGLPWIADFRDSMTEPHYPPDRTQRHIYRWIERKTVRHCARAVFTTPGAVDMYRRRYPEIPENRWMLIPNGYDEAVFDEVEGSIVDSRDPQPGRPLILLHSGVVYPSERDPKQFFEALSRLKTSGTINASRLRVRFRACRHMELLSAMVREHGIDDLVELLPGIPYRDALVEMMTSDALLILQASSCNHQVPAKVYEYFRARRPLLALTDPAGDTAQVIRNAGIQSIVPLDDADAIAASLPDFLRKLKSGECAIASDRAVAESSRRRGSEKLAEAFTSLIEPPKQEWATQPPRSQHGKS